MALPCCAPHRLFLSPPSWCRICPAPPSPLLPYFTPLCSPAVPQGEDFHETVKDDDHDLGHSILDIKLKSQEKEILMLLKDHVRTADSLAYYSHMQQVLCESMGEEMYNSLMEEGGYERVSLAELRKAHQEVLQLRLDRLLWQAAGVNCGHENAAAAAEAMFSEATAMGATSHIAKELRKAERQEKHHKHHHKHHQGVMDLPVAPGLGMNGKFVFHEPDLIHRPMAEVSPPAPLSLLCSVRISHPGPCPLCFPSWCGRRRRRRRRSTRRSTRRRRRRRLAMPL